jgi:hypothetical protein
VTALVLIGLDVALQAPASRLTALLAWPAGWLAGWMDPGKPLIGPGKLATAAPAAKPTPQGSNPFGALGYVPKIFGF